MDEAEFVNVAIRIKPGSQQIENKTCIQIINKEPPILLVTDRNQTFTFDHIFDSDACQKTVYEQTVKPLVKYVKQGYNCTVFGYGQTGTGKTYTIGTESEITNEENLGLIPRTLRQFFQDNNDGNFETEIFVSFIEIYNERVFDLLQNNNNPLVVKGMKPQGFCQEKVYNLMEAQHFLKTGNKNRHTAGTKQNSKSSRSHAIFTIYCNVKNCETETKAKLNLVDLAGCESVKKTGSQGGTFHEGVNINKGLLSISQVMMALSTNASFIPYRQSVITSVLQDSLNKRNYISLIACVSSLEEDTTETLQTLDFAQRLKKVKSRPELNEVIAQFKKENPNLFPMSRMGVTPFKRPPTLSQQTPYLTKRMRPLETTDINTICLEQNHTSKSLLSLSGLSTVSCTNTDITQQTLSPVIKKYVSAMEASLMDKLEVLIKTNLRRPNDELESRRQEEKENGFTPRMNWNKIHTEVSKMVKSEMSRLKTKPVQLTSSPIEFENVNEVSSSSKDSDDLDRIKKKLVYDSPESEPCFFQPDSANCRNESYETPIFKVPQLPVSKAKIEKDESVMSISPIENLSTNPRRSLRLSLKNPNISNVDNLDCSQLCKDAANVTLKNESLSEKSLNCDNRRRSVRLLNKIDTVKMWEKSCCAMNKIAKVSKNNNKRRNLNIASTPNGKRIMTKSRQDSPLTAHTKKVLNILQKGSARDLEKLQLIGTKTAHQILLFRQIKGNLKEISDLSQMPGWGDRKFEKFVDQNFLKKELL